MLKVLAEVAASFDTLAKAAAQTELADACRAVAAWRAEVALAALAGT